VNREDARAAETLLRRAIALLPLGDRDRDRPLSVLAAALVWTAGMEDVFDELEASADPVSRMNGRLARTAYRAQFDPAFGASEVQQLALEADELYAAHGDEDGRARAWIVMATAHWIASRAMETLACVERACEHARRAGTIQVRAYALAIGPLTHGPLKPDEARARYSRLFGGNESRFLKQGVLMIEAMLLRFEGRFDDSLAAWREGDAILAELGLTMIRHVMRLVPAECESARGRFAEAAQLYREVYDDLGALGEQGFRSTVAIELAEALYALGERDEAEQLAVSGEAMGGEDDLVNFALGRALRARLAADRGDADQASVLAREAIAYGERSDFPGLHASVYEAQAHVLAAAGDPAGARACLERAIAAHDSHGDVVLAERARALPAER
jgi:tetratricopeptide (TPR) repeat protein